jgi:hypothetical protein
VNRYLAGLAIAAMLMGLGCGEKKEQEKVQVFLLQGRNAKEIAVATEAAAATGTQPTVWTIQINTTTGAPTANQCTANIPWQGLYTQADSTNNDFIRFKAATTNPQQTYRVVFPGATTAFGAGPVTIDNIGTSPTAPLQVTIDPATCLTAGSVCAYPYNIFNITNPAAPVQCNNGANGPPYGVGSDGIVIKGGGG